MLTRGAHECGAMTRHLDLKVTKYLEDGDHNSLDEIAMKLFLGWKSQTGASEDHLPEAINVMTMEIRDTHQFPRARPKGIGVWLVR